MATPAALTYKYKEFFGNKRLVKSLAAAVLLLILSLVVNFYAASYATEKASNSVTDIVLSNIRVFDIDGIFIYGAIIFWIFMFVFCLFEPKRFSFTLKSIALFVIIRSIFISLTHIGPFPYNIGNGSSGIAAKFLLGADLFFSGHAGLPFLMALVFWEKYYVRNICIISSIIFGVVALLGHLHYTIDVVSAFFITYTIYHLSEVFFSKDLRIFNESL